MRKSATLCILFFSVLCLTASGQQQGPPPEGPALAANPPPWPVEYSDNTDDEAIVGGGAHNGADPEQVLYTQPNDMSGPPFPFDSVDYGGSDEVDALANAGDYLYWPLTTNRVELLISFVGDPAANAVYFETNGTGTAVGRGVRWTQAHLNDPNTPASKLDDLDGLEIWGPLSNGVTPVSGWDANLYSLVGEPGGTSIFAWPVFAGPSVSYLSQATIQAAVVALGYVGPAVDVDGLMASNADQVYDTVWNTGDEILFSIRASGTWDGGEIVRLPFTGAPSFLNHGGHLWNTAFGVSAAFLSGTEDVDGIEAFGLFTPGVATPAVSNWGFLVMGVLVLTVATLAIRGRRMRLAGA